MVRMVIETTYAVPIMAESKEMATSLAAAELHSEDSVKGLDDYYIDDECKSLEAFRDDSLTESVCVNYEE